MPSCRNKPRTSNTGDSDDSSESSDDRDNISVSLILLESRKSYGI